MEFPDEVLCIIFSFLPMTGPREKVPTSRPTKRQRLDDPQKSSVWACTMLTCKRFLAIGRDVFDPKTSVDAVVSALSEENPIKIRGLTLFRAMTPSQLALCCAANNCVYALDFILRSEPETIEGVPGLISEAIEHGQVDVLDYFWDRSSSRHPTEQHLEHAMSLGYSEVVLLIGDHYNEQIDLGGDLSWAIGMHEALHHQHDTLEHDIKRLYRDLGSMCQKYGILPEDDIDSDIDDDDVGSSGSEDGSEDGTESEGGDSDADTDMELMMQGEERLWNILNRSMQTEEDRRTTNHLRSHMSCMVDMLELVKSILGVRLYSNRESRDSE